MTEESQAKVVGDTTEKWLEWKCVFCKQEPKDVVPKLLPCFHSCCGSCLTDESSNDNVRPKCPVCMQEFIRGEVIDNYFVKKQPSDSSTVDNGTSLCTSCEDSNVSTSFCVDCVEWLCDACVQAHQRVRMTKDHTIQSKDNASQGASLGCKQLFCPIHKQELLKLFCETCDQLTCRDCQLVAHRDHKYQFVSDASKQQKALIQMMIVKLTEQKVRLKQAQNMSSRMYDDLIRREEIIREEIRQFALKFIAEIGQRSRQLVKDLHMTCGQKKMKLNAVQSYLASVVTNMDHKLSFIKTALDQGSDLALLYSKRTLMKQLEALNNVKIHTPPIGTTIDIRFIYDINALINFVHKFGMLIAGGHPLNASAPAVSTIITTPTSTNPIVSSVSTSQLHGVQQSCPQVSSSISVTGRSNSSVLLNLLDQSSQSGGPGFVRPSGTYMPPTTLHNNMHSTRNSLPVYRPNIMQESPAPNVFLRPSGPGMVPQSRQRFVHPPQQNFQQQQACHQRQYYHQNQLQPQQQLLQPHQRHIQPKPIAPYHHPLPPRYVPRSPNVAFSHFQQMNPLLNRFFTPQQSLPTCSQTATPTSNVIPLSAEPLGGVQVTAVGTSGRPDSNSNSPSGHGVLTWPGSPLSLSLSDDDLSQDRSNALQPKVTSTELTSCNRTASLQIKEEKRDDLEMLPESLQRLLDGQTQDSTKHHEASSSSIKGDHEVSTVSLGERERLPDLEKIVQADSSSSPNSSHLPPLSSGLELRTLVDVDQSGKQHLCLSLQNDGAGEILLNAAKRLSSQDVSLNLELKRDDDVVVLPPPSPRSFNLVDLTSDGEVEGEVKPQVPKIVDVVTATLSQFQSEDPNEDWCAVCHDGGELLCCGSCPRVYHLECHVPELPISATDEDNWKCLICESILPLLDETSEGEKQKSDSCMSSQELKVCQRILLELFCHEASTAFHKRVSKTDVPEYYRVIAKPMHLEKVKKKLKANRYSSWRDFISDVRLIFVNCFSFNAKGTEIYNAGIILETFFKELLVMYNLSDNKLSEENGILCDTRPRKRLRTSTSGNLSNDKECDPQYTT